MKYQFEMKKEHQSLSGKIIVSIIYFSFYFISMKLFIHYLPFINQWIIITLCLLFYLLIIIPMNFTPKWLLNNQSIIIIQPSGIIDIWRCLLFKKTIQMIDYKIIQSISITFTKTSSQYIFNNAYVILFNIQLKSGDCIIFDSLLGMNKDKYLDGIRLLQKRGIHIIDQYHIMNALQDNQMTLWEYLKKMEEGHIYD